MALADTLTNLETTRDLYAAALAADAVSPQADYSLDGESVQREAWRKGLLDRIKQIQETIVALDSNWTFLARGVTG